MKKLPKLIKTMIKLICAPIVGIVGGIFLPIIHGIYVHKLIKKGGDDTDADNDDDNEHTEKVVKRFKALNMICESIPQLIFTSYCYVRAFHAPQRGIEGIAWTQLISMFTSFIRQSTACLHFSLLFSVFIASCLSTLF